MNDSLKFNSLEIRSSLFYGILQAILAIVIVSAFFLLNLHILLYRLIHESYGLYVAIAVLLVIILGLNFWFYSIKHFSRFRKNCLTDPTLSLPSEIKAYSDCLVFTRNGNISKFYFTDITKIVAVHNRVGVRKIVIMESEKTNRIEPAIFTMTSDSLFKFLNNALPTDVFSNYETTKVLGNWRNSALIFVKNGARHNPPWYKRIPKFTFVILLFACLMGMIFWGISIFSNSHFTYENDQQYERSSYHNLDGTLYYNGYEGRGYKILKNADVDKFKLFLLPDDTYSQHMGYDDNGVYYHNEFMPLDAPADVIYLGSNYWIYQENVYYALTKINSADVASFRTVSHQNDFLNDFYYYANDDNHVYYEGHVIRDISPHNLKTLDEDYVHLLGDNFVCYKQYVLDKMSPNITHYNYPDNDVNFITDDKHFAINHQQLTGTVSNYYFGNTSVDDASLKLLMVLPNYDIPVLLADNHHLYYYDHKVNQFICREDIAELRPFNEYLVSDGSYIYYTAEEKGSKRRSGNHGSRVSLYKSPLLAQKLMKTYSDKNIDVYKYNHTVYALIKDNINIIYLKGNPNIIRLPRFVEVSNPTALKELTDSGAGTSGANPEWFTAIEGSEKILDINVLFD